MTFALSRFAARTKGPLRRRPPRLGRQHERGYRRHRGGGDRGAGERRARTAPWRSGGWACGRALPQLRSEEHTSELQSLMRISYAVFCLKKKKKMKTPSNK